MNIIQKEDTVIYIFLTICSLLFFYYIYSNMFPVSAWREIAFEAPDSKSYIDVGNWLINKSEFNDVEKSVATRPFFYPLVVALLGLIHPFCIVLMQIILWQVQLLLIYYAVFVIINSRPTAILISLISLSIISPAGAALHVLSETLTSFLLTFSAVSFLFFIKNRKNKNIFLALLAVALCSVSKPVYYPVYIILLLRFFISPLNKRTYALLLLTATPVIIQFSIMNQKFSLLKISFIDSVTINDYFLTMLEVKKRKMSISDGNHYARIIRENRRNAMSLAIKEKGFSGADEDIKEELLYNITNFPLDSLKLFFELILQNSAQPTVFFAKKYKEISLVQSKILRMIFLASFLLFFLAILQKKDVCFSFFTALIILTSYLSLGISCCQGDRFLIPIYNILLLTLTYNVNLFRASKAEQAESRL